MKRFFFLLSAVLVSLTIAAQMQVWSNGTIIFSHDQTDVDSISFGSPMQVKANLNAFSSTSLAGNVYVSSFAGGTKNYGLFFLDGTNGYYGYNADSGSSENSSNKLISFTYTISGNDITLSMNGRTVSGKVIGKNGLVFTDIFYFTSTATSKFCPAFFINLNH